MTAVFLHKVVAGDEQLGELGSNVPAPLRPCQKAHHASTRLYSADPGWVIHHNIVKQLQIR